MRRLYTHSLSSWPAAVREFLYRFPGGTGRAAYGPGNHGHWALQSNNTAAAAFAVLATDDELDEERAGMSREEMLDWALAMIRFALSAHVSGNAAATDRERWGHSWISALCMERLAHGVEALGGLLPEEDRAALERVTISEALWLLENYEVVAGLIQNNKPESNIWNGCMLNRAVKAVPNHPRCSEFLEKGTKFLLNGISIPEDADSGRIVAGRPLSAWHVGPNMTSEMGCDHHGYQNVGYMVICLSNIAMMHFSCQANGWDAPPGLYHHARELWQLVKACTFPDGRLLRIGGDTRVRYCYCQDYAVPAWLWARDYLGEDTTAFECGWLQQIDMEMEANGDGTFLSRRLAKLKAVSPLYYVRLEGDRACSLSMGSLWHRLYGTKWARAESAEPAQTPDNPIELWSEDLHGSCLSKGIKRTASWTWRAAAAPQGLCVPAGASSMAEWQHNLSGRILGMGRLNTPTYKVGQCGTFPGGFATCGTLMIRTQSCVAEGDADADIAVIDLACVALPDDRTVAVLQRGRVLGRPYLREVKGLFLQVGNDIFNGGCRRAAWEGGERTLGSCPGTEETIPVPGDWLTVDDSLSVVRGYGPGLYIHRPADRQVNIVASMGNLQKLDAGGNLYVEEICCGCRTDVHASAPDTTLFDLGVAVLTGVSAGETAAYANAGAAGVVETGLEEVRALRVTDAAGKRRIVVANFADEEREFEGRKLPRHHVTLM